MNQPKKGYSMISLGLTSLHSHLQFHSTKLWSWWDPIWIWERENCQIKKSWILLAYLIYSLASKSQCKLIMQWISHLTIYFLSPLLCELERVFSKVHLVSSYKLVLVLLDLGIVFVLFLQYSLPRVILFSLVLWPLVSLGASITPVIHHGHLKFHHSRDSLFSFD